VLSLVVLISGGGSNLRALLEASEDAEFPARVVAVGDLVVLSGFMKLLPPRVVDALSPNLINTHPAYLPEFPGAHGVRDAIAAAVAESGASVIVVDNGMDSGPIISQRRVRVLPGDTEHELHERIKLVERELLVQAVLDIANGHVNLKELSKA
jgi:phosphoribosylglycinamide formyltransferase-1